MLKFAILLQKWAKLPLQKLAYAILDGRMNGLMNVWLDGGTNVYGYGYCSGYVSTLQYLYW